MSEIIPVCLEYFSQLKITSVFVYTALIRLLSLYYNQFITNTVGCVIKGQLDKFLNKNTWILNKIFYLPNTELNFC